MFFDEDTSFTVTPDEGNGCNAELHYDGKFNQGLGVDLILTNLDRDFTGELTWTVRVEACGMFIGEKVFTINVEHDTPDDMPTGVIVNCDYYEIDVGGTIQLDYEIFFEDDKGIDDSYFWRDYVVDENENVRQEWNEYDERFVNFHSAGRYVFKAIIGYNNYCEEKTIAVVVGSGSDDYHMDIDRYCYDVYADRVDFNNVVNIYLSDLVLFDGENVEWTCEPIGDHGENPAELSIDRVWDNWLGAELYLYNVDANYTGEYSWKVAADVTGGSYRKPERLETTITLNFIAESPSDAPTYINVGNESHSIGNGELFSLHIDQISFGDGNVPDEAPIRKMYWCDTKDRGETWEENGEYFFRFYDDGRYVVEAVIVYNTIFYKKDIVITVSNGVSELFYTSQHVRSDTIYMDTEYSSFIGIAYIENADILDNEAIYWNITNVGDHGADAPELYIDNEWDNYRGVNLHVRNIPDGYAGILTWYVAFSAVDGLYTGGVEYTVNFMNLPDNVPTEMTVPNVVINIHTGETLELSYSDIEFAGDGQVPGGVSVWSDYDVSTVYGSVDYSEEGKLSVVYSEAGTYQITAYIGFNSYVLSKEITVNVTDAE